MGPDARLRILSAIGALIEDVRRERLLGRVCASNQPQSAGNPMIERPAADPLDWVPVPATIRHQGDIPRPEHFQVGGRLALQSTPDLGHTEGLCRAQTDIRSRAGRTVRRRSLMKLARLTRQIDERECAERNALSAKPAALVLAPGTVGAVLDTFSNGDAFLVEFGSRGPDQCDWLGVLYASELQLVPEVAMAA